MADLKHIQDRLWELRATNHRVLYVMVRSPTELVVLHAFKKQGQKTPLSEKKVALARMAIEVEAERQRERPVPLRDR